MRGRSPRVVGTALACSSAIGSSATASRALRAALGLEFVGGQPEQGTNKTDAGQGRGQGRDEPIRAVEARVVGKGGECLCRLGVQQDHAGDFIGVSSREDAHVRSTRRVSDEDVWPGHAGTLEQGVQVGRESDPSWGRLLSLAVPARS